MQLTHERTPKGLVVRVQGDLDLHTTPSFRDALDQVLEQGRVKALVLNLEGVGFIDSTGLGAILGRYKRLAQQGGKMALVAKGAAVRQMLEVAGIHRLMAIAATEEAALERV